MDALLLNIFLLNGIPLVILDQMESMDHCQLTLSEVSSMQMPLNESYKGFCIYAKDVSITPTRTEVVNNSIAAARAGYSTDKVYGWDVDTGRYRVYINITNCLSTKDQCGYVFQEFSYKTPKE